METDDVKKYAFGCGALMLLVLCVIYAMPFWSRPAPKPASPQAAKSARLSEPARPPKPVEIQKTPSQMLQELSSRNQQPEACQLAMKYLKEGSESEKLAAEQALPSLIMNLFEDACSRKSLDDAIRFYGQAKEICAKSRSDDGSGSLRNFRDGVKYMGKGCRNEP